jgi:hypothetical protein
MRILRYSFHGDVFVDDVVGICDVTNVFMYASMRALVKRILFLNAALADRLRHTIPDKMLKTYNNAEGYDILRLCLYASFVIQ